MNRGGQEVVVRAEVQQPGKQKVNIDFTTYQSGSKYRAYNVAIEGASLVTVYRNQFGETIRTKGIDGLIATNTTISRKGLPTYTVGLQGGVSGRPLTKRANAMLEYMAKQTNLPIIGVGGIMNADDALARLDAGATLIQVYTGMIYAGPGLVKSINKAILRRNC